LLVALAGCGGHGAATTTQTARKPPPKIRVQLAGQSHHPRVGERWSYEVRVTDAAGKPVAFRVHLQFLFGGVPVGQVGRHRVPNGVWRETFGVPGNPPFPERARGQPLVLQAVVTALGETRKVKYWIKVR
jgi:ribosomal protein S30